MSNTIEWIGLLHIVVQAIENNPYKHIGRNGRTRLHCYPNYKHGFRCVDGMSFTKIDWQCSSCVTSRWPIRPLLFHLPRIDCFKTSDDESSDCVATLVRSMSIDNDNTDTIDVSFRLNVVHMRDNTRGKVNIEMKQTIACLFVVVEMFVAHRCDTIDTRHSIRFVTIAFFFYCF
jgi:hypothetical protein